MDVGIVGLGGMGSALARRLLEGGFAVTVWNRSPAPAEALAAAGATRVDTAEAAMQGDVALTMLADDTAIRAVLLDDGALSRARGGLVHLISSTISVALAQELEVLHQGLGVAYVAAPVVGRPDAAAAGRLDVLTAGPAGAIERARPVLAAIGKAIRPMGEAPHMANVAKLAINLNLAVVLETYGEVFALVRRYGVDPHALLEAMTGGVFDAPAYRTYGPMIADARHEPAGFRLKLGLKDVRLALEAGGAVAAPLPLASLLRDHLLEAIAHGDAEKDWSAVARVSARHAGLEDGPKPA